MTLEYAAPRIQTRPCRAPASDPRWSLIVAILGSTMAFLDNTVVNVALPVLQRELGGTVAQMQWIVEAYTLLLSSLVLVGGALGDRHGRRRTFVIGVAIFSLASVLCGLAPSAHALIWARAFQGVGGALLVPGSLSLISAAYDERARGRAFGIWSAASAVTSAVGPVLGGWLVTHASYRWLFFINVPLGVLVVALALRRIGESRDEAQRGRPDFLGATLVALGLGSLVFALLEATRLGGLSSLPVLGLVALGSVLLVSFVAVEARRRHPMVPLELFRSRTFTGTNLLTLLLYAALGGGIFFVPFNLVQVQGYTASAAGAALLPLILLISVMSPAAGRLMDRFGARLILVVGPLVAALGFALLALPSRGGSYLTTFFPGLTVLGVGMGMTVAPLTTAVMGSVDERHAGVASGVNNAVARTAGLLAVAALGALLVQRFDASLDVGLSSMNVSESARGVLDAERSKLAGAELAGLDPSLKASLRRVVEDAYVTGFRSVMSVCAVLSLLGATASGLFVEAQAPPPRA